MGWAQASGPILTLALTAACGGAAAPAADAGPLGDAGVALPTPPAEPTAPATVSLGPCPSGWRSVAGADGATVCDPWPASGPSDACAFDEAHLPGTEGCARLGTACAADGWPSDLPTDRVATYVDAAAAPGGDGSTRASAFTTITEAVNASGPGTVIAIAVGHYDERQISLRAGQTLWGACVSGTRITSSDASDDAMLVDAAATGLGVRNLAIEAPARFAIALTGGDVTIEDVVIDHAHGIGFYEMLGTATLRGVVVRGTEPVSDGRLGDAIWLVGGTATIERTVLDQNREYALYLSPGSAATVHDLSAQRTMPLSTNGYYGHGIGVEGATLDLARAAIERNLEVGIELIGASTLHASDVVVRQTGAGPDGSGWGISGPAGSHLVLDRVDVEDARAAGVIANGAGAVLDAHDLVVRRTAANSVADAAGFGLAIHGGATGTLARVRIADATDVGVLVTDEGSSATVEDLTLSEVSPVAQARGNGIMVQAGALLVLSRADVAHVADTGIAVLDGAGMEATDLHVADATGATDGSAGRGVFVGSGASATLERARIERVLEVGIAVRGGTLALTDVTVADVASRASDGLFGRGIDAELTSMAMLTRVRVSRTHDDGVFLADTTASVVELVVEDVASQPADGRGGLAMQIAPGAHVTLDDVYLLHSHMAGLAALGNGLVEGTRVVVRDVVPSDCAATTCAELAGGFGVVAQGGGAVTLRDFEIDVAVLCGVAVGTNSHGVAGAIDLHHGRVSRVPIGACVQVGGYDVERLHDRVEYLQVDVPLQATSYMLPSTDLEIVSP